jgi:hypothetical protein
MKTRKRQRKIMRKRNYSNQRREGDLLSKSELRCKYYIYIYVVLIIIKLHIDYCFLMDCSWLGPYALFYCTIGGGLYFTL